MSLVGMFSADFMVVSRFYNMLYADRSGGKVERDWDWIRSILVYPRKSRKSAVVPHFSPGFMEYYGFV